jgi:arylformamidase
MEANLPPQAVAPDSTPVYRGMTREQLERQYDLRTAVPDHEAWGAKRVEWSARARATLRCELDIRYGETDRQALDIFPAIPPADAAPGWLAPVEIYIHGGAWRAKSKSDVSFVAEPLVPAGVTFVAIDHDLLPSVTLDEIVAQVRRAVAWIHAHIADHGGDPDRLHISGHSSGGHLSAMVIATDWEAMGLPADTIKAACLTSGMLDLEPVLLSDRNGITRLDADGVARLSPMLHLPSRPIPLVMSVGGRETPEFIRLTMAYRDAWEAAGLGAVRIVEMPDDHHYSLAVRPGQAGNPLFEAVLEQIRAMPLSGGSAR